MNFSFKKLNNMLGIVVFVISAIVYLMTIEPNISFWDCGEYISSAAKLEVTHSPGAATFQLIGAVFSMLAFGDGSKYPMLINAMNAIFSAITIMLMFWSIVHLMKKALQYDNNSQEYTFSQQTILLGSGLIGALSFAFTDTFWYNAVEGEVYASASMFTALLVWLICKWENDDSERANRWLVLIAFVIGLSVGIHMMVLLAVPTVCYIYYAKNHQLTLKSFIIANVITILVLAFVFVFIFPFVMTVFGETEIFLVNGLSLPFNSGLVFALLIFVAIFYFSLKFFQTKKWIHAYTIVISIAFMLLGFTSWLMIPIRANANPPMNLNNPDNALGMKDYYNREQYGDWPIFYGANYTAFVDPDGIIKTLDTDPIYEKNEKTGRYDVVGHRFDYEFSSKHLGFLPRMYYPQNDTGVQDNYGRITEYPEFKIKSEYASEPQAQELVAKLQEAKKTGDITIKDYKKYADLIDIEKPTLFQNLQFMFTFQFNEMFLRYFKWNFIGKQNDIEWQYDDYRGNWESGLFKNAKDLPKVFQNKGTNHYFFLPLILGLIGFFFHLNYDLKRMYAILVLFLLTGFGIIIYTSVKPFEPRERDYALVSSFYAFAIWIGLGAGAILYFISQKIKNNNGLLGLIAIMLGVPFLLAFQNWDDHDRSHRKTAIDQAYCYLKPLGKDAILFTYGDNDTYPLWGAQETSGLRTDVKAVNFTLLGTSWYIDQVKRKTYEAMPIPGNLKHDEYVESKNDQIIILEKEELVHFLTNDTMRTVLSEEHGLDLQPLEEFRPFIEKDSMTAKEAIAYLRKKSAGKEFIKNNFYNSNSEELNILPVSKIVIPVNKSNAIKYGIVNKEDAGLMQDFITIKIKGNSIRKAELAMLDMFANYNWDKPIYFGSGGVYDPNNVFFLQDFLEYQGFVYKLVPIKTKRNEDGDYGRVNANNIYNVIKQFHWGNFKDKRASFDETGLNNIVTYRQAVGRAVIALYESNQKAKAKELLDLLMTEIPMEMYPGTPSIDDIVHGYILVGEEQKALQLAQEYQKTLFDELEYYMKLPKKDQAFISEDMDRQGYYYAYLVESVVSAYNKIGKEQKAYDYAEKAFAPIDKKFDAIIKKAQNSSNEKSEQNYNLSTLVQSYSALTDILGTMDTVYAMERREAIQSKLINAGFK